MRDTRKVRKVLITGGPTRAYLDDVRFLTNASTGRLAYELCKKFVARGTKVTAVIGPTELPFEKLPIEYIPVETNDEMLKAVLRACRDKNPEVAVFSAAVLDFVPLRRERGKVSSQKRDWAIHFKPFPKIIDLVGQRFPNIGRVGFKLESKRRSGRERDRWAERIRRSKGLDMVVVNFLSGIQNKDHTAYLYRAEGPARVLRSKSEIAAAIVDFNE